MINIDGLTGKKVSGKGIDSEDLTGRVVGAYFNQNLDNGRGRLCLIIIVGDRDMYMEINEGTPLRHIVLDDNCTLGG